MRHHPHDLLVELTALADSISPGANQAERLGFIVGWLLRASGAPEEKQKELFETLTGVRW